MAPARLALIGLFVVRLAAAVILVAVVARALYYPFWAAGASHEDLERSWGGPSALGATVVHWLVAAAIGAGCLALIVVSRSGSRRLRPERAPR